MASLYELEGVFKEVYALLDDETADEQAALDTLESIGWNEDFEAKAESYAKLIRNFTSDADKLMIEVMRMKRRSEQLLANSKEAKKRLEDAMKLTGKLKFKTALFNFSVAKRGGGALVIDKPELIPPEFMVTKPAEPDKANIREYLKTHEVEWAHIAPQAETLSIR